MHGNHERFHQNLQANNEAAARSLEANKQKDAGTNPVFEANVAEAKARLEAGRTS